MLKVKFYESVEDSLLEYAVIISRSKGKWVFCRHRERTTYEAPGGHRETGEAIVETAHRELWEDTGAEEYDLFPVCAYSVAERDQRTMAERYGMLYYADIQTFQKLPESEIEEVLFFFDLPDNWTYPLIQPKLLEKVKHIILD